MGLRGVRAYEKAIRFRTTIYRPFGFIEVHAGDVHSDGSGALQKVSDLLELIVSVARGESEAESVGEYPIRRCVFMDKGVGDGCGTPVRGLDRCPAEVAEFVGASLEELSGVESDQR